MRNLCVDGSAMDYGVNSVRVNGCEWISIVPVQHDPHFSNNTVCHIILSLIMAHYTMRNTSFSHKYFIYLTYEITEKDPRIVNSYMRSVGQICPQLEAPFWLTQKVAQCWIVIS